MNIFVLDLNIDRCAEYHADQHVVKMILEYAQMLCTVLGETGGTAPYKPTHVRHPCTIWTGESLANWLWLRSLALRLNGEYRYRFDKTGNHRSADVIQGLELPGIPDRGLTPFAQTMPEQFRVPGDPVAAYRNFYNNDKYRFVRWTRRPVPPWFQPAGGGSRMSDRSGRKS